MPKGVPRVGNKEMYEEQVEHSAEQVEEQKPKKRYKFVHSMHDKQGRVVRRIWNNCYVQPGDIVWAEEQPEGTVEV